MKSMCRGAVDGTMRNRTNVAYSSIHRLDLTDHTNRETFAANRTAEMNIDQEFATLIGPSLQNSFKNFANT